MGDGAAGEGGAADGVDLFLQGFFDGEAVPVVEEAVGFDVLDESGGLCVGQQVDSGDDFLGVEGDEHGCFAGVALDAVGGGLAVDGVAEQFLV